MAYGIVHQFPGGTEEQYQAALAAVHPSDGSLPDGQVLTSPAPRTTAGSSSRSTIRSRAGSSSATTR
jgi:hypothetical protein